MPRIAHVEVPELHFVQVPKFLMGAPLTDIYVYAHIYIYIYIYTNIFKCHTNVWMIELYNSRGLLQGAFGCNRALAGSMIRSTQRRAAQMAPCFLLLTLTHTLTATRTVCWPHFDAASDGPPQICHFWFYEKKKMKYIEQIFGCFWLFSKLSACSVRV